MKKPRVLLRLAALVMGLCLLAGCAAQPAAPAQATSPHIETSPQPTTTPRPAPPPPSKKQALPACFLLVNLCAHPSVDREW